MQMQAVMSATTADRKARLAVLVLEFFEIEARYKKTGQLPVYQGEVVDLEQVRRDLRTLARRYA